MQLTLLVVLDVALLPLQESTLAWVGRGMLAVRELDVVQATSRSFGGDEEVEALEVRPLGL